MFEAIEANITAAIIACEITAAISAVVICASSDLIQTLGLSVAGGVHCHPGSTVQVSLHPSALTKLLSSHSRVPIMMSSPQISVQVSF